MAKTRNVEALKYHMAVEIHGKEKVEGLTVRNNKNGEIFRLDLQAIFIEVGVFPKTHF